MRTNTLLCVSDMISTEFEFTLIIALILIIGALDYSIRKEWPIFFSLLKQHDPKLVSHCSRFGPSVMERAVIIFQLSFAHFNIASTHSDLLSSSNKIRKLNRFRWFTMFATVVLVLIYT